MPQLFKLGVDENPKSLKRARCGILARLAGFDRASHDLGQLDGTCKGPVLLPPTINRLCNRPSKPFFAVVTNDLRHLFDRRMLEPLRHALATCGVHAHVQWSVVSKRKSSTRIVELRRAHAQIHQQAIDAGRRQFAQLSKALVSD